MNNLLRHPAAIALLGIFAGLYNASILQSDALGFLSICLYLGGVARMLESRFNLGLNGAGFPATLATLMVFGSALYYATPISTVGLLAVTVAPFVLLFKKPIHTIASWKMPKISRVTAALGISTLGATILAVQQYTFDIAVRSPWDIIPTALVLLPFALLTATAIHAACSKNQKTEIVFALLLFLVLMVTPLAYKLGYGFDPFVHRATLEHILEHGTITPKPLYYIGQYALELIGTSVFGISLAVLDTWLVPLLAALLLPYAVGQISGNKRSGLLALLVLPLGPFIFTTPQSLSYIFFALTVAGAVAHVRNTESRMPLFGWIMALATLVIHPLSGIPALCIAFGASFVRQAVWVNNTALGVGTAGLVGAIPLLFIAQSVLQGIEINLHVTPPSFTNLLPDLTNHYGGWLDMLYLYTRTSFVLLGALAVLGTATAWKKEPALAAWSTASTLALLASYLILSSLFEFSFLVESERANYANRLPYLALLSALPLLVCALHTSAEYIKKRPIAIPSFIIALTLIGTSNAYASFPRNDGETRSAGFNVSTLDYETAQSIHALYDTGTYAVLANQSLSASALHAYGFATYFKDDIFYYPIPTGGELYEIFLKMANEDASRINAKEAADLTGASHVIFVSHRYWSGSETAREQAKREADKWYSIGGNQEIMIFLYDFSDPQ